MLSSTAITSLHIDKPTTVVCHVVVHECIGDMNFMDYSLSVEITRRGTFQLANCLCI